MGLGMQLKILFLKTKSTQKDAAKKIGISSAEMSWICRDRLPLTEEQKNKVAKVFKLDRKALDKNKVKEL